MSLRGLESIDAVKGVVVVASGQTERRAIPILVAHLEGSGASLSGVRTPPRNGALNVDMAESLIKAAWYGGPSTRPEKFVIVLDVDRGNPEKLIASIKMDCRVA